MKSITPLKTFDTEALFSLLQVCAHNLALAYQEIQDKTLFFTSQEAYQACDYLLYRMQKESQSQAVH